MKNNKKSFFVIAGGDPTVWQFWLAKKDSKFFGLAKRSNETDLEQSFVNQLLSKKELKRNQKLIKKANGLIPIMYEYAEPYRNARNLCNAIPIPINISKIQYNENKVGPKLIVFHGLNRRGAKGTDIIEKAFDILNKKYPEEIECIIDGGMPYDEYIKFIQKVNVIVDQTNASSLAVNSLISLAQGKVTLGGCEETAIQELGYKNCPSVNISDDVNLIVEKIEGILKEKHKIPELGRKSREFVEKHHDHILVAKKYLRAWDSV